MIGWDNVSLESLSIFKEKDFEQLCGHLVRTELTDRHTTRVMLDGPGPSGVRDGGGDLLVKVPRGATPRLSKQQYADQWPGTLALTPDRGRRVYSCKTGKKWQETVRSESKRQAEYVLETLKKGGLSSSSSTRDILGSPD